jgi:DNA polymerase III epsilon subunit-like protein
VHLPHASGGRLHPDPAVRVAPEVQACVAGRGEDAALAPGSGDDVTAQVLALVDLETTSLDPNAGHVVEVALGLYSVDHRCLIRCRSWLCAAPAEEVAKTESVHGIPPELVAARGVPFEEVAKQVHAIVTKEATVFVAHNADFDRAWLPLYVQNAAPWACSCHDISWPKPSTSRGLTALALAHGIGVVAAHRALDDVLTLARLFERAAELGGDIPALLTRALRPKGVYAVADTKFDEARNALAKAAGFHWEKPHWVRKMAHDDVAALPFAVRELKDVAA